MKQIKFLAIALTFLMGVTFTSCLDSDSESSWDRGDYVTITESMGYVTLKGDFTGYTFRPNNPSVLKLSDGKLLERAFVYVKYLEGEVETEGKTSYNVSIYDRMGINTKGFTNEPDTINDKKIVQLLDNDTWGINGYLNVSFTVRYTSSTTPQIFDMYPVKADEDLLTVKLCHSYGQGDNPYNEASVLYSYKIPYLSDLQRQLDRVEGGMLVPANDSISIVITADGIDGGELTTRKIKVKSPLY